MTKEENSARLTKAKPFNFQPTSPDTGRRILVVDDDADTRGMLRTVFELEKFEVLEATDGETAIDAALKHMPDLILMDMSLPNIDGVEATQLIRSHSTIAKIPIIFLTGRAEPARRRAALEAGCNDFLVKPIHLDNMLTTVARWLEPDGDGRYPRGDGRNG